ncbi:PHP domain-containing protein [Bdellovibrionota bacterium FG-1]
MTEWYAELRCRTHYSFLRGASHPAELVERAAALGLQALAITDLNGVYGVPKAYSAWKNLPEERRVNFKLISGAELTLAGDLPGLTLLAANRAGYGLMCRLLSASHEGKSKGDCSLEWRRFLEFMEDGRFAKGREGLFALPEEGAASLETLRTLRDFFGERLYLPVSRTLDGRDQKRIQHSLSLAQQLSLEVVATNEVHYHHAERRKLQDSLTSIRCNRNLNELGFEVFSNGERFLKSPAQMAVLFQELPQALRNSVKIANHCSFSPSELRYRYPSEWIPTSETAYGYLRRLTFEGAQSRYGALISDAVLQQLEHELKLVNELGFADYFLTIWEIVEFARAREILCQGRGSAANSAICYCLGITAVDPVRMNLLFERFISAERGEPPDIDVDFEHERREEVIQHIYQKYGRDRAGMVAAVVTYRTRSAIRDISKALGLRPEVAAHDPTAQKLMDEIYGFPRHLSIHSGGFTLSADPIIETVPIEPARMEARTIVQWDKEDLAVIGLLKVDILALGMLTAIQKTLKQVGLKLYGVPADDLPTYQMIQKGDTVGVFQIESRAQMGMLRRLKPQTYYDLVIQVAIVRPGPIVGQMVHPYLRRRKGEEIVDYPHPKLVPILSKTLGVPLFQEQVMKMAIELAGFTPGEADELRRAIGAWRSSGSIERVGLRLREGLLRSGLPLEFVERIFKQIQGFAEYGFPESHAASFALLAYVSAYLKCHYPAEFCQALLNSQPMGFYSSHTLVDEVKRHGVLVFPVHPHLSGWDSSLEKGPDGRLGIRIGFRVVRSLSEMEFSALQENRTTEGPFLSLGNFVRRTRLKPLVLEGLAMGDAFACFGLSQREALWELLSYRGVHLAEQLDFFSAGIGSGDQAVFSPMAEHESIRADYRSFGLSTQGHPMQVLRKKLKGAFSRVTSQTVRGASHGSWLQVAGLVIACQRPPTAKGMCFATLEDQEGLVDLVIHAEVYEKYEEILRGHGFLGVSGKVQADQSLMVKRIETLAL